MRYSIDMVMSVDRCCLLAAVVVVLLAVVVFATSPNAQLAATDEVWSSV